MSDDQKAVDRKPMKDGSLIGIDVNKPVEALAQLAGAETWELVEIVMALARLSNNVRIIGTGLLAELAKRAKAEMDTGADSMQAHSQLQDVSVEQLAAMPVTSEGN